VTTTSPPRRDLVTRGAPRGVSGARFSRTCTSSGRAEEPATRTLTCAVTGSPNSTVRGSIDALTVTSCRAARPVVSALRATRTTAIAAPAATAAAAIQMRLSASTG
jgi:hypothetical protein